MDFFLDLLFQAFTTALKSLLDGLFAALFGLGSS